jgi:hypothetical protein
MESQTARQDRYLITGIVTVLFFAIGVCASWSTIERKGVFSAALYCERLSGIPWWFWHVGVCLLCSLPMLWGASNFILLRRAAKPGHGFWVDHPLYLPFLYFATTNEAIRRPLRRVLLVVALYLPVLVAWAAYDSYRGG